jgi:hypothetical protein
LRRKRLQEPGGRIESPAVASSAEARLIYLLVEFARKACFFRESLEILMNYGRNSRWTEPVRATRAAYLIADLIAEPLHARFRHRPAYGHPMNSGPGMNAGERTKSIRRGSSLLWGFGEALHWNRSDSEFELNGTVTFSGSSIDRLGVGAAADPTDRTGKALSAKHQFSTLP